MISAYTPIKNEKEFVPIYVDNLKNKVDEIYFFDTGSTDGTLDEISVQKRLYPDLVKLEEYPSTDSYRWEEGKLRNYALSKLKNPWVVNMDADEVLSDNFNDALDFSKPAIHAISFVPFWKDIRTVRLNSKNDERWFGNTIVRAFHRDLATYDSQHNHCTLLYDYRYLTTTIDVMLFHLHYALFKRCKMNDNRLGDLGKIEYWGKNVAPTVTDEDFEWLVKNPAEYELHTSEWTGSYPDALKKYL